MLEPQDRQGSYDDRDQRQNQAVDLEFCIADQVNANNKDLEDRIHTDQQSQEKYKPDQDGRSLIFLLRKSKGDKDSTINDQVQ